MNPDSKTALKIMQEAFTDVPEELFELLLNKSRATMLADEFARRMNGQNDEPYEDQYPEDFYDA